VRLGIMQPYFFPYLGYFELIARTDRWVVLDTVQYNRKSWMNRNRILHPNNGWQYINAPVHHAPRGTLIEKVFVQDIDKAQNRILAQLGHYRGHAPYYHQVIKVVQNAFTRAADKRISTLNIAAIESVCDYIGIYFSWLRASDLGLDAANVEHAGEWALRISKILGADAYMNPIGGRELFVPSEWDAAGIKLSFTTIPDLRYECWPYVWEPLLSIVDVLMWLPPKVVRDEILKKSLI
jgi:hypothetical protein